jgi:aldehyde dehydrogenase (NAD+)
LAQEAGIPDGVINVVPGYGPTAGAAIVRHPGVDKIAFTGELATAKVIQREAAETMKRMTFELGGKSPNVIFADADIDAAVAGAHFGLYFNQGQCCCAGSRLFVEQKVYDDVIERLADQNKQTRIGDPFDPDTQQGPQVDEAQFEKILKYIDYGKKDGAKCITGGKRFGSRGYFVEPTLFAGVEDNMRIAREEIFGPVMSVLKFKNEDELIRRANDTNFGLAAAVWTRDVAKAHRYAREVRAGTVWVNCYDVFDAGAPFGGFKQSGLGRELGEAGLDGLLQIGICRGRSPRRPPFFVGDSSLRISCSPPLSIYALVRIFTQAHI